MKVKTGDAEYVALDHDEVLQCINRVREAWGWLPLAGLPKAEPSHSCTCVLGRSWHAYISGTGLKEYVSMRLNRSDTMTRIAATVLGLQTSGRDGHVRMVFPAGHPLMVWMTLFDSNGFPQLNRGGWCGPIDLEEDEPLVAPEDITLDLDKLRKVLGDQSIEVEA